MIYEWLLHKRLEYFQPQEAEPSNSGWQRPVNPSCHRHCDPEIPIRAYLSSLKVYQFKRVDDMFYKENFRIFMALKARSTWRESCPRSFLN